MEDEMQAADSAAAGDAGPCGAATEGGFCPGCDGCTPMPSWQELSRRLVAVAAERDGLSRELSAANEENERLFREEQKRTDERDRALEALEALKPASAAEDWHREYGREYVARLQERDRARNELAWRLGQLQTLRGLCDGIMRFGGTEADSSVTVRAIRETIDALPTPSNSQLCELAEGQEARADG